MKERPILFSAPMVKAILDNRKCQTRRIVKPQPAEIAPREGRTPGLIRLRKSDPCLATFQDACPNGRIGDRLWVKETFYCDHIGYPDAPIGEMKPLLYYRARDAAPGGGTYTGFSGETMNNPWRPSIFMPRWASRITLEITGLRCERLHDISEEDAKAEGATRGIWCGGHDEPGLRSIDDEEDELIASYRDGYRFLWECINGPGSWALNPWVWVIEFTKLESTP